MEWVETTGRSVQEAKEAALDELGVDEADAEFEVLAEAQTGLFGRLRSEARVRARVRPTAPRAKEDRRDRRRRAKGGDGTPAGSGTDEAAETAAPAPTGDQGRRGGPRSPSSRRDGPDAAREQAGTAPSGTPESATPTTGAGAPGAPRAGVDEDTGGDEDTGADDDNEPGEGASPGRRNPSRRRRRPNRPVTGAPTGAQRAEAEAETAADDDDIESAKGQGVEVDLDHQAEVAVGFLQQLTAEFGLSASVAVSRPDDETVELQLSGRDLGILIGPKGTTLLAIQNLVRTVVFNETGGNNGHINVDVGGYRQKRSEALARFATEVAESVKQSGARTVLEPMSSVDRKVVHDTISGIDGVSTISEGEEPRRRVVVLPG